VVSIPDLPCGIPWMFDFVVDDIPRRDAGRFMIAKYNRKSLALGIPGLILQIGCILTTNLIAAKARSGGTAPPDSLLLLAAGSLVGTLLLIIGLGFYAKAKGYSAVLGLLGLLSCLGLLVLALLPDKTKGQTDDHVA
jgi:hypothetical protein